MDFRTKIDLFMKEKSISNLKQLAIKSDIPYTTLRDCYEKNNADNSRMSTIRKLAKYMNCTTDYLGYDDIDNLLETNSNEINHGVYIKKADGTTVFLKNASNSDKALVELPEEQKKAILAMIGKTMEEIDNELDNK